MKLALFLSATLLSSIAFAGNSNHGPHQPSIIASIAMDIDKDGEIDLAHLATPEKNAQEDLDLWIKLSSDNEYFKVEAVVMDMNGGMAGMGTELTLNPAGSLQVYSYNDSIGRTRWEEYITFAYRKGTVVLAGYTHNYRDTLDLSYINCDVNLLSRKGVVESERGNGTFEVNKEDVLSLEDVYSSALTSTYLEGYCVGTTSDMDEGDSAEVGHP